MARITPRVYKTKDTVKLWSSIAGEETWRGFVGNWFQDPHKPDANPPPVQGLRTWRWRDASHLAIDQVNVFNGPGPFAAPRESDGLHAKEYVYDGDLYAPEKQEDPVLTAGQQRVLMQVDLEAYVSIGRMTLPGPPPAGPPPVGPPMGPPPVWSLELFLKNGNCRWSTVMVYGVTADLFRIWLIQESGTTADPHTPHVIEGCWSAVLEPRPQLGPDPAAWVDPGSAGRRVARVSAAPDGSQLMREEELSEPVEWNGDIPPDTAMFRLPDSMYVRLPHNIATAPAAEAGAAGTATLEFGGLMRHPVSGSGIDAPALSRIVVRYDKETGAFAEAVHEVFPAAV